MSLIDAATLQAYRETEYRVCADAAFVLRVDEPSAPLAAAHAHRGVDCSAYVTACNPRSRPLGELENAQRHAALGRELARRGFVALEGRGEHPRGGWPGEASYLVFGLTLAEAKSLGRRWGQNALLWSGEDAVPRLVLLR